MVKIEKFLAILPYLTRAQEVSQVDLELESLESNVVAGGFLLDDQDISLKDQRRERKRQKQLRKKHKNLAIYNPKVITGPHAKKTNAHANDKNCLTQSDPLGLNYKNGQKKSKSGQKCLKWKSVMKADKKKWKKLDLPRKIKNRGCLNPNGDESGPWCFVKNGTSGDQSPLPETCGIQLCQLIQDASSSADYNGTCLNQLSDPTGLKYSGDINLTTSRKYCKNWNSKYPYGKSNGRNLGRLTKKDRKKVKSDKTKHNYCRNWSIRRDRNDPKSNFGERPWCFVDAKNDEANWEYCDIPVCPGSSEQQEVKTQDQDSEKITARKNSLPQCGVRQVHEFSIDRIVNGQQANPNEFPWQAHLRKNENAFYTGYGFCGGSILNENYILTAAHCLFTTSRDENNENILIQKYINGMDPIYISVAVGWHLRAGMEDFIEEYDKVLGTDVIPSKNFVCHEKYDEETLHFDIALIELKRNINFPKNADIPNLDGSLTTNVRPVCLPTVNFEKAMDEARAQASNSGSVDEKCIATGWGDTKDTTPTVDSQFLIMGAIPVITNEICHNLIDGYGSGSLNPDGSNVCAMHQGDGVDTCQGDSGGPLVCRHASSKSSLHRNYYAQVGITSWGYYCGDRYPGVYTRVSNFVDWILEKSGAEDLQILDV